MRGVAGEREAGERLVDDRLEGGVAAVGVAEAPELAAVAVALAEVGDRVLEEPLLEIGGAAAADVDELLAELGVQLFQGVVVVVVGALQPLRDELVGVEVERLQHAARAVRIIAPNRAELRQNCARIAPVTCSSDFCSATEVPR